MTVKFFETLSMGYLRRRLKFREYDQRPREVDILSYRDCDFIGASF